MWLRGGGRKPEWPKIESSWQEWFAKGRRWQDEIVKQMNYGVVRIKIVGDQLMCSYGIWDIWDGFPKVGDRVRADS